MKHHFSVDMRAVLTTPNHRPGAAVHTGKVQSSIHELTHK